MYFACRDLWQDLSGVLGFGSKSTKRTWWNTFEDVLTVAGGAVRIYCIVDPTHIVRLLHAGLLAAEVVAKLVHVGIMCVDHGKAAGHVQAIKAKGA